MRTVLPYSPGAPLANTSDEIDIFVEGDELYDAMHESIAAARSSILLENYILSWDEVGRPMLEAMAARAREGLDVRVHVDAFGSLFEFPDSAERQLKEAGVQVRRFHRWQWGDPWRYNRRNHRKLLIIDRREAYLGGFNIHRESSRRHYGEQRWRDTHVRVFGHLAEQACQLFDTFWHGRRRDYHPPASEAGRHVLLSNHDHYGRRRMSNVMDELIDGATDRLWLTNPYFVPSRRVQSGLITAARRGVDVRVLVPGKNDVRLARWASHAAYAKLLAGGVRIFEYLPRVLHSKTALADDRWSMIGTSNLDYRSFFLNYEVNLFSGEPSLCSALRDQFLADLRESAEILPDKWSRRNWSHYPLEGIGWLARRWL
jgi:cardiolipin synthase